MGGFQQLQTKSKYLREQSKEKSDPKYIKDEMKKLTHHFFKNDIILSNWDFIQEENATWKIDAISMRPLKECKFPMTYDLWRADLKKMIYADDKTDPTAVLRRSTNSNI